MSHVDPKRDTGRIDKTHPFPGVGTSAARLNSRTAEPAFGGTNDAAMVSTAVGFDGGQAGEHLLVGASRSGQLSLITTTSGPGVSGIGVLSSCAPRLPPTLSQTVNVPFPTLKSLTQPAGIAVEK